MSFVQTTWRERRRHRDERVRGWHSRESRDQAAARQEEAAREGVTM